MRKLCLTIDQSERAAHFKIPFHEPRVDVPLTVLIRAPVHAPEPQREENANICWALAPEKKKEGTKSSIKERSSSSKIELEPLPLPTHYAASRTAATDRCQPRLHCDNRATNDLANAVCAASANTFGTGEAILQKPWPTTTGTHHLQVFAATAEGLML